MNFEVDLGQLSQISGILSRSGDSFDGVADGAPGEVDAGEVSSAVFEALAFIAEQAGALSQELHGLSGAVNECRGAYEQTDKSALDAVQRAAQTRGDR
ncbi:hypothetical protein [Austwickia chelonae]|uniref:hypothetical protein n=1 Tax=Austwickia chelonae TaxID=100225 RepID=UPI0013C2E19F|nr:hypothetical protein [Austwickia chelonae]